MVGTLVYVTGVPGAGKSSVRRELRRRGLVALGTDEDEIGAFFGPDGEPVAPQDVIDSPPWRRQHQWRAVPARLDAAVARAGPVDIAYICGSVANEHEIWDRFDLVIGLVVDDATLEQRLLTRTDNDFGKHPDELALALHWNKTYATDAPGWGVMTIDATQPLASIVDHIVDLSRTIRDRNDERTTAPPTAEQ